MTTPAATRIPVWVVLPPRTLLLDVAGPIEVLRRANMEQQALYFDVRYAAARPALTSSIGLTLAGIEALPQALEPDAIVMVSGSVDPIAFGEPSPPEQDAKDEEAIVGWLRRHVGAQHLLVSICSGALLAARAGLFDGHACTTHHACCEELARIAPRATVLENRLHVEDGMRCSSAGVTAGTDLLLHLVAQRCGAAVALAIARHLVVYLRRSGSDPQLSPWLEGRNHVHPVVHRAQDAIAARPREGWTLASVAQLAGASPRHLSRLFNEHVGMSLPDYVNRLRVALAHELLAHTRLDMERVAERSGFASTRQLRRAWRRSHATSPRDART